MHRIAVAVLCLILSAGLLPPLADARQDDSDIESELIAALNAWRMEEAGLWPLQRNAMLDQLAHDHATYLLGLPEITGDIHAGPGGNSPQDRALAAGWPSYGRTIHIAIGENAKIGPGVDDAINWWKGSALHRRTVVNLAYREVGVAMLPHEYGYLTIVVFGARPNILPVFYHPLDNRLLLSDERFSAAARSDEWLYEATQVRLLDSDGNPLGDWQDWQPQIDLPPDAGSALTVVFTDGTQEVETMVDLARDVVLLPSVLAAGPVVPDTADDSSGGSEAVTVTTFTTPDAASAILPTVAPVSGPDAAPDVTATDSPTPFPATAMATPPAPTTPDALILYDDRTLALINVSGEVLDVTGLLLVRGSDVFAATRWDTPWLGGPLDAVPAGDCLQIWSWDEPEDLPLPAQCRYRLGVLNVAPEDRFWVADGFVVMQGDTVLATCAANGESCEFAIP